jgi:hypothetical protein
LSLSKDTKTAVESLAGTPTTAGAIYGENNFAVDIYSLSSGIYILKLHYDHRTVVKKLIKE